MAAAVRRTRIPRRTLRSDTRAGPALCLPQWRDQPRGRGPHGHGRSRKARGYGRPDRGSHARSRPPALRRDGRQTRPPPPPRRLPAHPIAFRDLARSDLDRGERNGTRMIIVNALGALENPNAAMDSASELQQTSEQMVVDARAVADAKASGLTAVNITLGYTVGDHPPYEHTVRELDVWDSILAAHPEDLRLVRSAEDIRRAHADDTIGIIYGFQNAVAVGHHPEHVDQRVAQFADRGVRVIQLTYNQANHLGDGAMAPENRGLTELGRQVIASLDEHRIMVDLSH